MSASTLTPVKRQARTQTYLKANFFLDALESLGLGPAIQSVSLFTVFKKGHCVWLTIGRCFIFENRSFLWFWNPLKKRQTLTGGFSHSATTRSCPSRALIQKSKHSNQLGIKDMFSPSPGAAPCLKAPFPWIFGAQDEDRRNRRQIFDIRVIAGGNHLLSSNIANILSHPHVLEVLWLLKERRNSILQL